MCGGVGCTPANTSSLTSADCCATEIVESGRFCDVTGVAPCIITTGKGEGGGEGRLWKRMARAMCGACR